MTKKKSGVLKKIVKILGLTFGIVLILLVALVYSLRFPKVQQYITQKAVAFYHSKVDANASIDRLYVDFPSNITIEHLYLEDKQGDTLVNVDYLTVQTDLWALLDNRLHLSEVTLNGLKANILRPDSIFNFQFIIDGFTSEQDTTTNTSTFEFSIRDVSLSDAYVKYDDHYTGITTEGNVGELSVGFQTFDLNQQSIKIATAKLQNADASLKIFEGLTSVNEQTASNETQNNFTIDGDRLILDNVKFNLEESSSNIRINHQVGHLDLLIDELDINKNVYLAEDISIKNTSVFVDQFAQTDTNTSGAIEMPSESSISLYAGTKNITLENSSFKYHSYGDSLQKGFDPLHMWVQKLNTSMSNTFFENGDLQGEINSLSAFEKSGLRLKELQGDWQFTDTKAKVSGLKLSVNNSKLAGDFNMSYPGLASIAEDISKLKVDVDMQDAQIDTDDLTAFVPGLDSLFQVLKPHHVFNLSANVKGSIDQLAIQSLNFKGLDSTSLVAVGEVKGLPDAVNATYNFNKIELYTTANDINHFIGDSLPDNLQLPKQLQSKLTFNGRLDDFTSKGSVQSSLGDIAYGLSLKMQQDSVYQYKGDIDIKQLQVGILLSNNQLGEVTLNGLVDGRGFSLQNLNTKLTGFIDRFDYNNYAYKSIDINGRIQDKRFDGTVAMSDENLDFDFKGLVNMRDSVPKYNFNLDLKRANLQALKFTNEAFKLRAKVNSDLAAKNIETLNGSLLVDGLTIAKDDEVYQLDTISLKASSNESLTEINFKSTVLDASFNGNFELNTLPNVLKQHFQRYLSDSSTLKDLPAQDFVFNVDFKNPGFFTNVLVPGLNEFVPVKIEGKYNSEEWLIDVNMDFEKVDYKGTVIDSLGVQLISDRESLNFTAAIDRLFIASSEFNNVRLLGSIDGDQIKTDFKILNEEEEDRYHIGGTLSQVDDHFVFEFIPGEFVLNYDSWKVHPENRLEIYEDYFWVENVSISREGQQLTAKTIIENQTDTVLVTNFDRFDLSFLGKFKETENYVLGGVLNGNVDYFMSKGSVKADLKINQFSYKGDTLGNINLLAQNAANKTSVDLGIKSRRNDIGVKGTITQSTNTELDLNAEINSLDISTVQAYAANEVSELDGKLTGQFKVTGTAADPDIKGNLNLDEVAFRVNYIGTKYFINDETIDFTRSGLSFNDFKVDDEDNNTLRFDGNINSQDYASYDFKLKMKANNFKVLNTDEKANQLVYGKLAINADADITGDLNNPKVRLDLGIANGSDVTYVIPEEEISVAERRGVVEFFDQDIENDPFFGESNEKDTDTLDVWIRGIDLRANIDVNSTSTFNVVIDPITQDKLTVSGDADLTLGMRPTGDMTLTGRYEVNDGSYDLNFYSLVKRKFDIRPGSYLLWTGDPLNARMDVSAIYTVRAAPVNTDFRRKIPFDVFLDLNGELLSPDISFRLALAEQGSAPISVQSWLNGINQQEAVLNRQVFSLLLFKTFMTSDFSSGGGDNNLAQSTARNSASRILSNQLNRLGSKIKGLELSFDLQSYQDYSEEGGTEGRTELELGLSKQFFDERVVVKVAGNFDLEGGESQQKSVSDFAGDIKIEYKLTEDGRYRLVGFRQNEYDNLLQGEIAKTGVGVIFVRDYNTLKELFKKSEEVSDEE